MSEQYGESGNHHPGGAFVGHTAGEPDGSRALRGVEAQRENSRQRARDTATLVAPMLPLPALRTSVPPNNFARSNPKGIEPRRYAAKGIRRTVIEISGMRC